MSSTTMTGSTLGVLARQEIRSYLKARFFWFGAALTVVLDIVMLFHLDRDPGSSGGYMIAPAALLGLLGLVVMFGLTRRSDRAAEAAGAVAVPERTRTLALAAAVVVPFAVALLSFVVAVVTWNVHPPADYVVPPGVTDAFAYAQMFGDGVLCAVGGPLLGLLLARYLPRRGVAAVASVLLVVATILLQGGGVVGGEQPYRVLWFWTYFINQVNVADSGYEWHMGTYPGNPYFWLLYLVAVCGLGVVTAVYHDPESDRAMLRKVAVGLLATCLVLGTLAMTVGHTESVVHPEVCGFC